MKEPYVQINSILGVLLTLVFIYSFFFPHLAKRGMSIPSGCEGLPEAYCKSRGLSRAFALIVRGDPANAKKLNPYSISIFVFFAVELLGRLLFSILFLRVRNQRIIYLDVALSAAYFLFTFTPMMIMAK